MQSLLALQQSSPYFFPISSFLLLLLLLLVLFYLFKKNKNITILNSEIADQKDELSNIKYELQSKDNELVKVSSQIDSVEKELNSNKQLVTELTSQNRVSETKLEEKEKTIISYKTQIEEDKNELKELNQKRISDEGLISELKTIIEKEREMSQEKLSILNEAKEKLTVEFENLGNKIFEDKSKKFVDQNKSSIETLINPLREQIKDFDKKVTDTYEKDSKDRITLKTQIDQLKNLNERISQDAINLTNALKGQTKTQGSWGEVVLEKVLEMSGLQKGREYSTQETFKSWFGKNYRPDVVIDLPEGKQVVVDSKVSLNAYEQYSSSENDEEKASALKNHLASINNHIKDLSSKSYEDLEGINSLNYVLLFIPIESAFMVAIENDKEIFKYAFDKNIILVCPSTLLATLRTIQSIWQFEYQNRNAQDIADRAGKLHDRFVDFVNHLESIGLRLNQANKSYDDAVKALSEGRGNLVNQVKQLEKLGAKAKKTIPTSLIEDDLESDETSPKEENKNTTIQFPKSN